MKILFIIFVFCFSVCLSQENKVYVFQEDIRLSEAEYEYLINDKWVMSRATFSVQDSLFSNDTIFYRMNIIEKEGVQYGKTVKIQSRAYYPAHEEDLAHAFSLGMDNTIQPDNYYLNESNILVEFIAYDYYKDYKDQLAYDLEEAYTVYENGEIVIIYKSIGGHIVLIKPIEPSLLNKIKEMPDYFHFDDKKGIMVCYYFIQFKKNQKSLRSRIKLEKNYSVFEDIRKTKWGEAFTVFTKIEKSERYNKIKQLVINSHLKENLPIYKRNLPEAIAPYIP